MKTENIINHYIDLHAHLDGCITPEIARRLAALQQITLPAATDEELLSLLSVPDTCENLNDFLKCFDLPLSLLQTEEALEEAVYLILSEMKEDGVIYAELRFAPQFHTQKEMTQETAEFINYLMRFVAGGDCSEQNVLSAEEIAAIEALAEERYRSWYWNFGYSPNYAFERSTKTPGGVLDVHMDVRDGIIADIRLFGDYFGVRDVTELEDMLCGCRHEREALEHRLALVHIDAFIQGIGERVFLDCLF